MANIALLVLSGLLYVAIVRRMLPDASLLLFAAGLAFFLFSVPFYDSLSWQATNPDKLSLCFSALCLYLVLRIDPAPPRTAAVIAANLMFFALVVLAYNSKEATFSLAPSMFLLLLVRHLPVEPGSGFTPYLRSGARSLRWLLLPLLYTALHVSVVMINRTFVDLTERKRIFGGDIGFNLAEDVRSLFALGSRHSLPTTLVAALAATAVSFLAAVVIGLRRRQPLPGGTVRLG